MKTINEFLGNQQVNESKFRSLNKVIDLINDAIDYAGYENMDEVIWDLLDEISDNGQDEVIMREIDSYMKKHQSWKNNIR